MPPVNDCLPVGKTGFEPVRINLFFTLLCSIAPNLGSTSKAHLLVATSYTTFPEGRSVETRRHKTLNIKKD